jgi:hypothetical protein
MLIPKFLHFLLSATDIHLNTDAQTDINSHVQMLKRDSVSYEEEKYPVSGHVMAQVVSSLSQSHTAVASVRSQASQCVICGGQSVTGTGFFSSVSVSAVSVTPSLLCTHSFICHRHYKIVAIESVVKYQKHKRTELSDTRIISEHCTE